MSLDQIDISVLPVDREFDRLQARFLRDLRFPRALERIFNASTDAAREQSIATLGWVMNATYCLLLLADYFSIRPHFHTALLVRCGIVLPLLMLVKWIVRRKTSIFIRELARFIAVQLVAFSTFFLYRHEAMAAVAGTQVVTIVVLLGIGIILRLRLDAAAGATLLCVAGNSAFLFANPSLSLTDQVSWSIALFCAACFTFTAGYSLERQERLNFLFQLRNQAQSTALAAANTELQRLSERDALTGISNRAAFEKRFTSLWNGARNRKTPLSAILIDVDSFKVVNDTRGHLHGDQVLKRVAALMLQSLRGKHDFAARYGGDEFVILLPETDLQAAYKVAERFRAMVQIAGSPATETGEDSEAALWTTVTCGVATIERIGNCTRQDLLLAADTALYAAKAAGRNRVHRAPTLNPIAPPASNVAMMPSRIA
ncbi:MAG: GGDEF domain-containing protein [Acidobacteriota bacterium]